MSFHRQPAPHVIDHASEGMIVVAHFVTEREVARVVASFDPFGVGDPCPFSSVGHQVAGACGEVVCLHCSMIF